ncbi:IclR family transcriptional regulator [Affinibrenneria salicis]|uniref:IclR family transcriptional regulator n=1 Tax=Affinibrenneria salicis TaxID=2590031 RepID=A0A5J5G076_9GAMM|nr:IclR family transcriptional regulator [Affinibrenneria salicis]KAA8998971.1 IclR family transcriptional regulator [Affinibrenneria salicis]
MDNSDQHSSLFNQSLAKGLEVLRSFNARRRSMTLAEIAAASGISKSSAQRMVYTLEQLGYVGKQSRTRRYQLTARALELGFSYLDGHPLIEVANPFLAELTRITGETSCLTEAVGNEMVYIARFVSAGFVPVHMPIGSRLPMYCTAAGRAWLSALPQSEARSRLLEMDRVGYTVHTCTGVEAIVAQLSLVRQRGYAINAEELFLGDMTLGAPIVNAEGRPVAAVHLVAPTSRWTLEEAQAKLAPALLACSGTLCNLARHAG